MCFTDSTSSVLLSSKTGRAQKSMYVRGPRASWASFCAESNPANERFNDNSQYLISNYMS